MASSLSSVSTSPVDSIVTFQLTNNLRAISRRGSVAGKVNTSALLTAGVFSCFTAVRADSWWGLSQGNVAAAAVLAKANRPLVITQADYGTVTPLTYEVAFDTNFALFSRMKPFKFPSWESEIFVYRPSQELIDTLSPYGELHSTCPMTANECLLYKLVPPESANG